MRNYDYAEPETPMGELPGFSAFIDSTLGHAVTPRCNVSPAADICAIKKFCRGGVFHGLQQPMERPG